MTARALPELETDGTTADEALATFDALTPVTVAEMLGRWRGSGLRTGHPMDGLLEELGWWGKEFLDADHVHPLLFAGRSGEPYPVDSRFLPVGRGFIRPAWALRKLFPIVRPLLRTRKSRARLRMVEFRRKVSAAMIYDFLPINDHFRRVDAQTVLGLMDLRGVEPFFFVLRRAT